MFFHFPTLAGSCRCAIAAAFGLVILGTRQLGAADDPVAAALTREFASTQKQAKQSGLPIMAVVATPGQPPAALTNAHIVAQSKAFVEIKLPPNGPLAKALGADTAAAFLNADGEVLARVSPQDSEDTVLGRMNGVIRDARGRLLEKFADGKAPAGNPTTAIATLIRLGASAESLVPLAAHKSKTVQTAVGKSLGQLPPDSLAMAAFIALASPDEQHRTVGLRWATASIKSPFKPPTAKFWAEATEEERQTTLEQWRKEAFAVLWPVNKGLLDFAEANLSKQVNNGECAMLVTDGLKSARGKPCVHVGTSYVWGREVSPNDTVLPGDIVQLEECDFKNGERWPHHTRVIRKVLAPSRYEVLEQNVNGRRTVEPGQMDLSQLTKGQVAIYRPLPR